MKTSSSAAGTGVRGPDCCVPAKLTGSPRMTVTPAAALNRSNWRREKLFLSAIESLLSRLFVGAVYFLRLRAAALALCGPPVSRWLPEERALIQRPFRDSLRCRGAGMLLL